MDIEQLHMDIEQLQILADRLSRATEPDRDLDEILWAFVHGWSYPLRGAAIADKRHYHDGGEKQDYSYSIDAALKLAEGFGYRVASIENVSWSDNQPAKVTIFAGRRDDGVILESEAAIPSLAILRALIFALAIKVVRDLKKNLSADDRAIVELAEESDAIFFVVGGKWFVGSVDGQFENCVEAARAFCEANDIPLPGTSGPAMR